MEFDKREYSTEQLRKICQDIYGKTLHDSTWKNWKRWIGIPLRQRKLDYFQALGLVAISRLRRSAENNPLILRKELKEKDIRIVSNDAATVALFQFKVKDYYKKGWRLGSEIVTEQRKTAKELSAELPGFNGSRFYCLRSIDPSKPPKPGETILITSASLLS